MTSTASYAIKRLRELYKEFNRRLLSPKIPSDLDKKILIGLEALKIDDPLSGIYGAEDRKPEVCGTSPQRVVNEVRIKNSVFVLTYWYFWEFDNFRGDHEDWEPVSLVYKEERLREIYARVHDGLVRYIPDTTMERPYVFFSLIGHTPIVKVSNLSNDILIYKIDDHKDSLRVRWVNHWYKKAEENRWSSMAQSRLEAGNPPVLDTIHWRTWGKHAIYLRI